MTTVPLTTATLPSGRRVMVSGEVVRLHHASLTDGSWVRATIETGPASEVVAVGATLLPIRVGCTVRLSGVRREHPEHGSHLHIVECHDTALPTTADGVARYLAAAGIHGCGVTYAKRIVSVLGSNCLQRLQLDPSLVEGVFPGRRGRQLALAFATWAHSGHGNTAVRDLMAQLLSHGISPTLARRVLDFFRTPQVAEIILRRRPYRLLDVPDIGWKRADDIARRLGVRTNDPDRLSAAITAALDDALREGHSALNRDALRSRTGALVGPAVLASELDAAIDEADEIGALVADQGRYYRPDVLVNEWRVARAIARLVTMSRPLTNDERSIVEPIIAGRVNVGTPEERDALSPVQREAVWLALESGVAVLSGRPGSGKTTTTATYLACCQALGRDARVAAPTGKAAARAKEVTRLEAETIHRLIGVPANEKAPQPVRARVLVVDETSMCSLDTVAWLLDNVDPARTSVLFCGDADQLPSVEHGAVLRDMVTCGRIPTAQLTEVHRQAAGSRIITNAHALLDGRPMVLADDVSDFRFVDVADDAARGRLGTEAWTTEQKAAQSVLCAQVRALIAAEGAVAVSGLQVLAPMRKGALGVVALNALLQEELNPNGALGPAIGGNATVRVGDRVIQVRNDYGVCDAGLMNGEQGVVLHADADRRSVVVGFGPNRRLTLSGVQLLNLRLAWAITVHRSQGSEWPRVMLLYHDAHTLMLNTRLLYTAITRAKRHFTLVGTRSAIITTERRRGDGLLERTTGLGDQLAAAMSAHCTSTLAQGV